MSSEFMFDEFQTFTNHFQENLREETFIIDVINKLGNLMVHDVKMSTPEVQSNHAVFFVRGGKLLVFEAPGKTTSQEGKLHRNWVFDGIQGTGSGYVVTISNHTLYASLVESGYRKNASWVERKFFLKITMEEIMGKLPKIIGSVCVDYLKRFGFL